MRKVTWECRNCRFCSPNVMTMVKHRQVCHSFLPVTWFREREL